MKSWVFDSLSLRNWFDNTLSPVFRHKSKPNTRSTIVVMLKRVLSGFFLNCVHVGFLKLIVFNAFFPKYYTLMYCLMTTCTLNVFLHIIFFNVNNKTPVFKNRFWQFPCQFAFFLTLYSYHYVQPQVLLCFKHQPYPQIFEVITHSSVGNLIEHSLHINRF